MTRFVPAKSLELTVALIKPHAAKLPAAVEDIKERILQQKFFVVRYGRLVINREHAAKMYAEHEGKSFYERLIAMMTSAPVEAFVLAREDAIKTWRGMMGPTRTFSSIYEQPAGTRGTYGLSNTRNATHGSDAMKSAEREAGVFFPDLCVEKWYKDEEIFFRNGYVKFDEGKFVHCSEREDVPRSLIKQPC